MSIFEAEVRGKTYSEDMLTSRIFGTLAILDKRKVLNPLLQTLGISLPDEEVNHAHIQFWEYYEGTYPDVSITTSNHLVFIEVKEAAPTQAWQLEQQYKAGAKNKKREFSYVLLTNDKQKPPDIAKAEKALFQYPNAKIHWNQWREIWLFLERMRERLSEHDISRSLIEDLMSLLEVKGMKYPGGLEEEWFQEVRESMQSLRKLYREIRVIIENVNEEVQKQGLEPMKPMPFRDRSDFRLEDPEEWPFPHLDFPYRDKKWSKVVKPSHNDKELYLYIGFYLDEAEVHVGFWTDNATDEQLEEARNKAEKTEGIEFNTHGEKGWLDLAYDLPLEGLRNGVTVVQTLVDRLVKARDFANTLETFRKELAFRSTSQQKKRAR